MKNIINFGLYIFFSLWIYIWISYGFGSIMNDFDMNGSGDKAYFSMLYRFLHILIISYLIIFYTTYRLFIKNLLFINFISIAISLLFLYESMKLIYENYYRNYVNVYELNSFVWLIEKYGSIVNMFYIFPLIFAFLYGIFVIWLYFKFRPFKKDWIT